VTPPFDYSAAAELFPSVAGFKSRVTRYQRFQTAAEAIRFALEDLPDKLLTGTALEVGDERFEGEAIRELYLAPEYPLPRGKA
jgi:hypothetical protein